MSIELDLSFWQWVGAIVFVMGVGFVSGRILGVRRGFLRATLAGVLGSLTGLIVAAIVLQRDQNATFDDVVLVAFGFALLATMVVSVSLEAVLRPRRRRRRGSLRTRVRAFFTIGGRLFEVSRIARRHGLAGPRLASKSALSSPEGGLRIRGFLEDCGGMFIKFGQIASTRTDLLPAPLIAELADLQSNVKAVPVEQIHERIESELGAPVSQVFSTFSDTPLAAASIGQTHTAELHDGRRVVVKVRRPDIEVGVARDSAVLRWASRAAVRRSEAARALGLVALADELVKSVDQELSYVHEAANARAVAAVTTGAGVEVPGVITELSSDGVLVQQRVEGRSVADAAAVDACGVERAVLADRLLAAFLAQVMTAGVFHADPHPGNILIDATGTLWLIDFGAVGLVDPVTMDALQMMAAGMATRQPALLARSLRTLAGAGGEAVATQSLEAELSRILSEQLHAGGFDPRSLQDIITLMGRHEMPVPPTLTLLARALVTLEGTLRVIDPRVDLATAAAAHFGAALELSPGTAKDALQHELLRSLPSLRALPALTEDIGLQLRSGRIRLQIDAFSGSSRTYVTRWLDQVVFASVAGVGLIASALMLGGVALARPDQEVGGLLAVGYIGLVISSVMLMRVVAQILRREGDAPG
jgi:ubiquinone biosynthesis protein